jgi:hypothetical protein
MAFFLRFASATVDAPLTAVPTSRTFPRGLEVYPGGIRTAVLQTIKLAFGTTNQFSRGTRLANSIKVGDALSIADDHPM